MQSHGGKVKKGSGEGRGRRGGGEGGDKRRASIVEVNIWG